MADLNLIARLDDGMSAAAQKIADSLNKAAAAGDQFEEKTTKATRSAQGWVSSADKLTQASNAVARAQKNLADATLSLNDGLAKGKISQDEANRTLDELAARVGRAKAALAALNDPLGGAATSTNKLQFAMRDLGLQSIDVFQGIATGQPILRTLIQQGAQVAQVNAAMGVGFRDMASGLGSMIARLATNPLVQWGAAIGAVVAVTVGWIAANESAEKNLLNMQAALRATRSDWRSMGEEATAAAKAVALSSSLSGADARGAAGVIAGAQNFHGTQADLESLIKTAGDLATVMGQKVPEAAKALAEALDDPAKVAKTLAEAGFPGMTNAIADTIRRMEDMGQGADATKLALDTIKAAVDDAREQSMTPLEQALEAIRKKFEQIGDAAVTGLNKAIAKLKELNDAAPKPGALPNLSAFGGPNLNDLLGPNAAGRTVLPDVNVTAERPLPLPPSPPLGGSNYKSINDAIGAANTAFNSSTLGQIQHYQDLIKGAQKALHDLADQGITAGDAVDRLNRGIQANQKSLDDATKKTQGHVSAMQKQGETIQAQIAAQEALRDAYLKGGDAIQEVLAKQTAEKQLISDGLIPGTQKYTAALHERTAQQLELNKATEEAKQAQDIDKQKDQLTILQAERDAIGQSNEARDVQIARLQKTLELKQQHADVTSELSQKEIDNAAAIARASDALQAQRHAMEELGSMAENIFTSIGDAITNAFVSGSGAAVNFGNVVKGIMAQVLSQITKLAIINPLLNGLFGGNRDTLGGLAGALVGGGGSANGSTSGGNSIFGEAQQLFGLAGIGDKLGITNIQGSISNYLGLNNLFSGTGFFGSGGTVANLLAYQPFGVVSGSATNSALAASGFGAGGEPGVATLGSYTAAGGTVPTTIGGLLGGFGAGFGVGSLAGLGVQKLFGKTGPAPTIGAGVGAAAGAAIGSIIPGIGTLIGGLIGGLFGGAGGGLIGPKPKSPYSATQIILQSDGSLSVGGSASQLMQSNLAQTAGDVQQFDQMLQQLQLQVASVNLAPGKGLIVGGSNVRGGGAIAGNDLASIFSSFGFRSSDNNAQLNARLAGQSFGSVQDLANMVATFRAQLAAVQQFIPQATALIASGQNRGSLAASIDQINQTYNPGIQTAQTLLSYQVTDATQTRQLIDAENALTAARDKATQAAQDAAAQQTQALNLGLNSQLLTAQAAISGDPAQARAAGLYGFDAQAIQQRQQFSDQLTSIYGDAFKTTQSYADEMALLERTLGAERVAIAKQFDDQIVAAQKQLVQTNNGIVANIYQADAAIQTDPAAGKVYALAAFDTQSAIQRQQFSDQLIQSFGAAFASTQYYVNEMALLEAQLGQQRLGVAKQYDDAIAAQQQQAAAQQQAVAAQQQAIAEQQKQAMEQAANAGAGIITNLAQYAASLQTGGLSPLSPRGQYALASSQFNAVSGAALAGDVNSLQQLSGYANTFLGASQNVNGSGAGYVTDFNQVLDVLRQAAQITPDTLTASVYTAETRGQTASLLEAFAALQQSVDALATQTAQTAATPARIAA